MSRKKYFCLKKFHFQLKKIYAHLKGSVKLKKSFSSVKFHFELNFQLKKFRACFKRPLLSWKIIFAWKRFIFNGKKNPCSLLQKDLYWVEKVICLKKFHPQLKKFHACFKDFFWIEKSMFAWNIFTLVDLFWEDKSISALKKFIFCWKISMLA